MKEDINIAEILKDMPKGTKLYSPICGECELVSVEPDFDTQKCIKVRETTHTEAQHSFWKNGKFFKAGECILWPGEHMKDWSKLTWKKGDVLVSNNYRIEIIFKCFADHYTKFLGTHRMETFDTGETGYIEGEFLLPTENYSIEDKDAAQCYLNTIEERSGGKLNPDTLDMEKKDEHIFKPFDKVLARNLDWEKWKCAIFSHMDATKYAKYITTDFSWQQCIPYEGNEHLLGTTNNP